MEFFNEFELEQKEEIKNEVQVLEFSIGENSFGVLAEQVREIMLSCPLETIPHTHRCVEGSFMLRNDVVTAVDLPLYLNLSRSEDFEHELFVVTRQDDFMVALRVHRVLGIQTIPKDEIKTPEQFMDGSNRSIIRGMVEVKDRLMVLLDFDKIVEDISPKNTLELMALEQQEGREEFDGQVLIAHDSIFLSKTITRAFASARFSNMHKFDTGVELLAYLDSIKNTPAIHYVAMAVLGTVMPEMEGYSVAQAIVGDAAMCNIPIVMVDYHFTEEAVATLKEVGVRECVAASNLHDLIPLVDNIIF